MTYKLCFGRVADFLKSRPVWSVILATLFLVVIAEVCSGLLLKANQETGFFARISGASANLSPMYYSDDQIKLLYGTEDVQSYKEMLIETWGGSIQRKYEPLVEHTEKEFSGKYVNITKDGYRRIREQYPLQRDNSRLTIYVFGGSTTFGYGVKDFEAIPSYLGDILKNQYGKKAAVYNFGSAGYYSTTERIKLERLMTSGFIPDMVVFIDGLNDCDGSRFPDASSFSEFIEKELSSDLSIKALRKFADMSSTVTLSTMVLNKLQSRLPSAKNDVGGAVHDNLDYASTMCVERLKTNIGIINGMAKQFNIAPLFVIQPVPFYGFDNSKRVVNLPFERVYGGGGMVFSKAYAKMKSQYYFSRAANQNILWLGDLKINENQYCDMVHYTPMYNMAIAKEIANYLVEKNLL